MKRHTVTATIIIALVALMIFSGLANAQQTAASSGQSNITTQDNAQGSCYHHPGDGCHHPGDGCHHPGDGCHHPGDGCHHHHRHY
jgi:hypothetical protein